MAHRSMEREPTPESQPREVLEKAREVRRSGAPALPQEDRRVVALVGTPLHVEAYPWTGGLVLWTQDPHGRWVRLPLRR